MIKKSILVLSGILCLFLIMSIFNYWNRSHREQDVKTVRYLIVSEYPDFLNLKFGADGRTSQLYWEELEYDNLDIDRFISFLESNNIVIVTRTDKSILLKSFYKNTNMTFIDVKILETGFKVRIETR